MATITALEAKTRFGELLERVGKGEEIILTRHEKPVAHIVPEGRSKGNGVRSIRLTFEREACSTELRIPCAATASRTPGCPPQ